MIEEKEQGKRENRGYDVQIVAPWPSRLGICCQCSSNYRAKCGKWKRGAEQAGI
jgi:hypothetical protein